MASACVRQQAPNGLARTSSRSDLFEWTSTPALGRHHSCMLLAWGGAGSLPSGRAAVRGSACMSGPWSRSLFAPCNAAFRPECLSIQSACASVHMLSLGVSFTVPQGIYHGNTRQSRPQHGACCGTAQVNSWPRHCSSADTPTCTAHRLVHGVGSMQHVTS